MVWTTAIANSTLYPNLEKLTMDILTHAIYNLQTELTSPNLLQTIEHFETTSELKVSTTS